MKKSTSITAAVFLLTFVCTLSIFQSDAKSQDLDSAIESEIDQLSEGGDAGLTDSSDDDLAEGLNANEPAVPAPKSTATKTKKSKPSKLSTKSPTVSPAEPLFDEPTAQDSDAMTDSDLEPLESPFEPPVKAERKESAPVPAVSRKPEPSENESVSLNNNISIAPGSDEPNAQFESRLAQIYAEHGDPVNDEKWTTLVGTRAAEMYSVQSGDTLWDLSRTLFADGFYWSRLWAENPEIQNPHQISKGQAIRFIGGNEASPPEIRVVEDKPDPLIEQSNAAFDREDVVQPIEELPKAELKEDFDIEIGPTIAKRAEPKPIIGEAPVYMEDMEGRISQSDLEAGVVIEQNELVPRPKIPPSDIDRRPVLKEIPMSFPPRRQRLRDRTVTISRRSKDAESISAALVPTIIGFDRKPEPLGQIVESEAGETVATVGQTVLIEANEPLEIGQEFYSLQEQYRIGSSGWAYEIGGVVVLDELVDESRKLYRGTVTYAVGPVRVNSGLMLGVPPRVALTQSGRKVTSKMVVVGGGEDEKRSIFGDSSIVFLEANSEDEVRVGDVLAVQARIGARRKSKIPDLVHPIGVLKVFAVHGKLVSTHVVLSAGEIRIGDYTGPNFPTRLPDLVQKAPRVSQAPGD